MPLLYPSRRTEGDLNIYQNRTLVRADNLEEMRKFSDKSIDLIATDPPFNSKRNYFVPYRDREDKELVTLRKAFTDTWTWGESAAETCEYLVVDVGRKVGDTTQGMLTQEYTNIRVTSYLFRLYRFTRFKITSGIFLQSFPC